jgi:hypothetical protein
MVPAILAPDPISEPAGGDGTDEPHPQFDRQRERHD